MNTHGEPVLSGGKDLPARQRPVEEVRTVDNGNGTATTFYNDGTSVTWTIGG
jgi:hypothetical protein